MKIKFVYIFSFLLVVNTIQLVVGQGVENTPKSLRESLSEILEERESIEKLRIDYKSQFEKEWKKKWSEKLLVDVDEKDFFIKSVTAQQLTLFIKYEENGVINSFQIKYLEEVKEFLFHIKIDNKENLQELEELFKIINCYHIIQTQQNALINPLQKLADNFFYRTTYLERLEYLYKKADNEDKERYKDFYDDVQRFWSSAKTQSLNFDKIIQEHLSKGTLDYATVLMLVGKMYTTNQYYLATKLINESIDKIEESNDTGNYFYQAFLLNLSSLYMLQGEFEKMLEVQLKQKELGFLNNEVMLMSTYLQLEEFEKALELSELFLNENNKSNPFYISVLHIKVSALSSLKKNTEAYTACLELIAISEEENKPINSGTYYTLWQISKEKKEFKDIEKYIKLAYSQSVKEIANLPEMGDSDISSLLYIRMFKFYYFMKYSEVLLECGKQEQIDLVKLNEEYNYFDYLIKNIMLNPSKLDKQQVIKLSEECGDIIYLMAEKMPSQETLELAYNYTLLSKEIGLSSVIAIRKYAADSKNKEYKNLFEHWMQVRKQILFHNKNVDIDSLRDISFGLHKELAIKTRKEVFSKIEENDISWKKVDNALKEKEVAIEYVYYAPNNYAALVVTKDVETPKFIPLCKEDELKQLIEPDVRQSEKEINDIIYNQNSEKIAQLIITPLLPYLNEAKTIYYSPTGILHGLAFDALKVNIAESPQRFGKEFKLRRVSKTSQIANKTNLSKRKATIFGGMNYDDQAIDLSNERGDERGLIVKNKKTSNSATSKNEQIQLVGGTFNYLNGTLKEVDLINTELTSSSVEVDLFTGTSATEDQFIEYCKAPTPLLHIASHAYFSPYIKKENIKEGSFKGAEMIYSDPDPMNRAGIVFSGANYFWETGESYNGKNDGILMASELSNYDLRDTKLAIISACQSGVGQSTRSEGVYGFQRAFKLAGIEHQIISLWTVDDAATQKFMTLFYKYFIELDDIDAAVNKAKDALQQEYNHPYYWAAFVHVQ
ncbi:CHAT domain-containing protein [Flammeovirga kamogawensis]|uniref:CHAT domain-containing protein n=1 Tax=Flammeovirga kamogawensis TaxID=373891 RepID=A0ABX8GQU1_9BACT|nr:CHAT domain-containing protein [Flammeovirga kamogawensis]MBB6463437.1 CHAT domain-containing protein [Flammeovirga kamogawensis]QWG05637.1 CHAT domain-containing protein [Flammeovirga kamogawensis]TRX67468.1 CHAT domain-containing protein [Flammeovirga kamogawensis]